ncbi:dTDP-4-dehydrorhamnose reductase [Amaricoccus tamworthensis]|uniref:dTDP-4-dehydrorhamnose reductase n=1 Tax=Amaricoccus tamworthensis TaxID=57002 RepID=UPI003C79981A
MRALVFGPNGQVGRELLDLAQDRGIEVLPVDRQTVHLTQAAEVARCIHEADVDIIVNAAAYTAVDDAEDNSEEAFAVNGNAPGTMARAAAMRKIPLLHISTDYVFDGAPGDPKKEDDPTAPLGVYGASKLDGENEVASAGGDHVILRTAWVFSPHGKNFVKTMLHYGAQRDELTVVNDQFGGPTSAHDIAGALWDIAEAWDKGDGVSGIFHFAGQPAVSWADFASAIFERTGWEKNPSVKGIPSSEWPTKTKRPENSVLDCSKIREVYGIKQPDWRPALEDVIQKLNGAA